MHTSPLNGGHTQSRTNAHSGSHTYTSTQTVFTCVFPHTSSHNHTGADTSDTLEGTHKLVPAGTTSHAQSYTERGTQPNRATPRSQTRTHTQSDTHSLTTAQKVMTHQDSQTHKPTHSATLTGGLRVTQTDTLPRRRRQLPQLRRLRGGSCSGTHSDARSRTAPQPPAPPAVGEMRSRGLRGPAGAPALGPTPLYTWPPAPSRGLARGHPHSHAPSLAHSPARSG